MTSENSELASKFLSLIDGYGSDSLRRGQDGQEKMSWEVHVPGIINMIQRKRPDLWNSTCLNGEQYPSHSEADFALVGVIVREALRLGISRDVLEVATQHVFRQSGLFRPEKVRAVISQTIPKIIHLELEKKHLPTQESDQSRSLSETKPKQLFGDLVLSEAHVKGMNDAKFIVPNLIVQSHMAAIVAPANSGKTALLIHFSKQIAQAGFKLYYINCDASPPDLKRHFEHATKNNYELIAPDAIPGKSPNDVIIMIRDYLETFNDLSNVVLIFDTLKKFVDVIEKRPAKEFYRLLRASTVRGCTVILLGHTNKHVGRDGRTIYEGTGDLRNDVDEMIYLDAEKDESKSALRVTTRPDKVRADIKPRSFLIHLPDRTVEELDKPLRILRGPEAEILELATNGIWLGNTSQKDLVAFILDRATSGVGERKVKQGLARHAVEENRITVRRAGRAKDLVFCLTPDERAMKEAQEEADRNSPF
jgi:KaiC/GvpD/RAD55 family RecA-like ATPase